MALDVVRIARDGTRIAEVPGGTGAFTDTFAYPEYGEHRYELVAVAGELTGEPVECAVLVYERAFIRGRINSDEQIDIADAVFVLSYLFARTEPPSCLDAADTNGDGSIDIADAILLLSYLMAGGEPPPPPFPECGVLDPPGAGLGCLEFPGCE
jgi:hypothetical protein